MCTMWASLLVIQILEVSVYSLNLLVEITLFTCGNSDYLHRDFYSQNFQPKQKIHSKNGRGNVLII